MATRNIGTGMTEGEWAEHLWEQAAGGESAAEACTAARMAQRNADLAKRAADLAQRTGSDGWHRVAVQAAKEANGDRG